MLEFLKKNILYILLFILLLGVGFNIKTIHDRYENLKQEDIKKMNNLDSELRKAKAEEPVDKERVVENFSSARTNGEKLAEIQNNMLSMLGDELKNKQQNAQNIVDSKVLLKSDAGSMATMSWYRPKVELKKNFKWKFLTTYTFNEDGTFPVIWTCTDKSGNINAYATANFSTKEKVFSDLKVKPTRLGLKNQVYEKTEAEKKKELQSSIDAIRKVDKEKPMTKEEQEQRAKDMEQIMKARAEYRERMKNDGKN